MIILGKSILNTSIIFVSLIQPCFYISAISLYIVIFFIRVKQKGRTAADELDCRLMRAAEKVESKSVKGRENINFFFFAFSIDTVIRKSKRLALCSHI